MEEEDVADLIESTPFSMESIEVRLKEQDILYLAASFECCTAETLLWNIFAEKYLKLSIGKIENIEHDCKKRSEKILKMFQYWHEREETCTFQTAIEIFTNAKLCGIKERWFSSYRNINEKKKIKKHIKTFREKARKRMNEKKIGGEDLATFLDRIELQDKFEDFKENSKHISNSAARIQDILNVYRNRFGHCKIASKRLFDAIDKMPDSFFPASPDAPEMFYKRSKSIYIVRCQGCKERIHPDVRFVIARKMVVKWRDKSNGEITQKYKYGHFHFDEDCVKINHPEFTMSLLKDFPQQNQSLS